jgi:hypothetical protein
MLAPPYPRYAAGRCRSRLLVGRSETGRWRATRGRILLVGGDANLGRVLLSQLRADGHCAEFAPTADRAAALAGVRPPRLVVLGDLDPPRGALDLLEKVREP